MRICMGLLSCLDLFSMKIYHLLLSYPAQCEVPTDPGEMKFMREIFICGAFGGAKGDLSTV